MLKKEVKKNMPVTFTRRNGQAAVGTVHSLPEVKTNGTWVEVNTGTKKEPAITNVRIEKLKPGAAAPASEVKPVLVQSVAARLKADAKKTPAPVAKKTPAKKK